VQYLDTAIELARSAGDILKHYAGRDKQVELKGRANLVTVADKESEQDIIRGIRERYPGHAILAEESGALLAAEPASAAVRWIIDPLDGTTNFAHGYPFYCVSIGVEENGAMVCGAVYDPVRDEMYGAARGRGAFCNGVRLEVSATTRLPDALLITGFPYNFRDRLETVMQQFRAFLVESRAVRRGGSAALDLCYLAAGRLDGFWELDLQPWDTAAGQVIAEEAGARITDFGGAPFSPFKKEILASNGRLHEEMLKIVGAHRAPLL
jgi:myo-inositol-1(or 4)-monophosphatase